jgi:3-oxoacyl-[acyl-carrier-protein] synthase II
VAPILAAFTAGIRALGTSLRLPDASAPEAPPTIEAEGWDPAAGPDPWQWAISEAIAAATDAATAARLSYPSRRIAVVNGTTHGSNESFNYVRALAAGRADPTSLSEDPAAVTRRIARAVGAEGPNLTINTACSSGLHSLGRAAALLADNEIDCAIAGGVDIVSVLTYLGFNSLRAVSRAGCRPLDRNRDGLTLGDGAAYFVLENERAARRRGITPLGFVAGHAAGADGHHSTAPDPQGACAERVMARALSDVDPRSLRLVAAHGTGTVANDAVEVAAIGRVVDALDLTGPIFVFALKSWLGHTLGAAGALEAATTLACMRRGLIPSTWGLVNPVQQDARMRLPSEPLPLRADAPVALCNAFGFGGSIASLCLTTNGEVT